MGIHWANFPGLSGYNLGSTIDLRTAASFNRSIAVCHYSFMSNSMEFRVNWKLSTKSFRIFFIVCVVYSALKYNVECNAIYR